MSTILEKMYKERVIYVHALEVSDVYELESLIENLTEQLIKDYTIEEVTKFVTSIQIYYLGNDEDEEEEVYNFYIENKVKEMIL